MSTVSPTWPRTPYDGSRRAMAALKDLTSDLIGLGRIALLMLASLLGLFCLRAIQRREGNVVSDEAKTNNVELLT